MSELMKFDEVEYSYSKNEPAALKKVSLTVEEGDYLAIVGTSGSGKSTLLSIMGLINMPTGGKYYLFDTDVNDITESSKARLKNTEIGLIFQNFNLLGHLSIFHNVCIPLQYDPSVARRDYREKVINALSEVGMDEYVDRYPGQLSGGQQQRVAIARAIVNEPSLILADEPTGNLDSQNAQIVFTILEKLNAKGCTVCLITHDLEYAAKAKRQLHIQDGQIITNQQEFSRAISVA